MAVPGIEIAYTTTAATPVTYTVRFEKLSSSTSLNYIDDTSLTYSATGTPLVSGSSQGVLRMWTIVGWLKENDIRILLDLWEEYRAEEASGSVAVIEVSDETFPHSIAAPLTAQAIIEAPPERPGPGTGPFWFPASIGLTEV